MRNRAWFTASRIVRLPCPALPCLQTVAAMEERVTISEDSGRCMEAALAQLTSQQGQNQQQQQQQPQRLAGPEAAVALAAGEVARPAELPLPAGQ